VESNLGPCRHGAEALLDVLPSQSVRACLELAHYLSMYTARFPTCPPRQGLYLTTSRNHTEDFVARGHHVDAKVAGV